jgi:glutaminase
MMEFKELMKNIGSEGYVNQFKNTLKSMKITDEAIITIDTWAKEMTSYGMLATYIPELKKVNKDLTAISIGDLHGNTIIVGKGSKIEISAQSVIKPFLYLYALEKGIPAQSIAGMEATAKPFHTDGILQPELNLKAPEHPLNNAGAISAAGAIENFDDFIDFICRLTGNPSISLLHDVFTSEFKVNNNNRAIASRLVASGRFKNAAMGDQAYMNYTKACSLGLTISAKE